MMLRIDGELALVLGWIDADWTLQNEADDGEIGQGDRE